MMQLFDKIYGDLFYRLYVVTLNPLGFRQFDILRLFLLLIVLYMMLRIGYSFIFTAYLRKCFPEYTNKENPRLFAVMNDVTVKMNLVLRPSLHRFSDARPLVFTAGFVKPAIFISPALLAQLDIEELRSILLHELAHIKRLDNLRALLWDSFSILLIALSIILFSLEYLCTIGYSLVLLLITLMLFAAMRLVYNGFIRFIRERNCDDYCVRNTNEPMHLASSLVKVWEFGNKVPEHNFVFKFRYSGFMYLNTSLERRLRRLIDYKENKAYYAIKRVIKNILLLLLFGLTAGIIRFHSLNRNFYWNYWGHKGTPYSHLCCDQCLDYHLKRK